MLKHGILNPALLELLGRFRHTNTLVIADRGFPSWPQVPTIDLSLTDGIPTVEQVLAAILPACTIGHAFMAQEFKANNPAKIVGAAERLLKAHGLKLHYEKHANFKKRVPACLGLIRTADTIPYRNIILESA
ncbi:MAG TPA: RbsD/FucU family protein [Opitutales bacterium]|nr:RbsD/FucU family protein [Opitutales bacterium]